MKIQLFLALILLFILPSFSLAKNNSFDGGVFYSTWGTGLQGNYFYTNEILFGGDIISETESFKSSGPYVSADGEINVILPFFLIPLLFSIVAFVYNCTLLTSDSDKYP